jgi:hypothetical protein
MAVDMRASGRKDILEGRCHSYFLRCGKALQRRGVDSPSDHSMNFNTFINPIVEFPSS